MARLHGKDRGLFERPPGSGIWWIQYNDSEGKKRREKVGTKAAARSLYMKRKMSVLQGEKLPEAMNKRSVTFADIAEDAITWSRANHSAWEDFEQRLEVAVDVLGNKAADRVVASDVESFLDGLPVGDTTRNRYRAAISTAYREAIKTGKIKHNPVKDTSARAENNRVIRWLRPEEELRLRRVILRDYPHKLPELVIALHTGMRAGEQYSLLREQVDLSSRILHLYKTKNGDERDIPLNAEAVQAFEEALAFSSDEKRVFPVTAPRKGKSGGAKHWWGLALEKANIRNFTWHCLRHTFATRLCQAGMPLPVVQQLMGHRSAIMTMRYSHSDDAQRRSAVDSLVSIPVSISRVTPDEPSGAVMTSDAVLSTGCDSLTTPDVPCVQ